MGFPLGLSSCLESFTIPRIGYTLYQYPVLLRDIQWDGLRGYFQYLPTKRHSPENLVGTGFPNWIFSLFFVYTKAKYHSLTDHQTSETTERIAISAQFPLMSKMLTKKQFSSIQLGSWSWNLKLRVLSICKQFLQNHFTDNIGQRKRVRGRRSICGGISPSILILHSLYWSQMQIPKRRWHSLASSSHLSVCRRKVPRVAVRGAADPQRRVQWSVPVLPVSHQAPAHAPGRGQPCCQRQDTRYDYYLLLSTTRTTPSIKNISYVSLISEIVLYCLHYWNNFLL